MDNLIKDLQFHLIPKEKATDCNTHDKNSIMTYGILCEHDDGYMCEHRAEYILNVIKTYKNNG